MFAELDWKSTQTGKEPPRQESRKTETCKTVASTEGRANHEIYEIHEREYLACISCISWFSKNVFTEDLGPNERA